MASRSKKWSSGIIIVLLVITCLEGGYIISSYHGGDNRRLQERYNDTMNAYRETVTFVNLRSSHPNELETSLITPYNPKVMDTVHSITGGWSDPGDQAEFWSDVGGMYNWVVDNIKHSRDQPHPILCVDPRYGVGEVNDFWQYPEETLDLRQGDCEDKAILLAAMIHSYTNGRVPAEVVVLPDHAAVYLLVDGEICILDPACRYRTEDDIGDVTSKDIEGEVYAWLDYLNAHLGGTREVQWIFSADIWKEFRGTDEFIDWMYSR